MLLCCQELSSCKGAEELLEGFLQRCRNLAPTIISLRISGARAVFHGTVHARLAARSRRSRKARHHMLSNTRQSNLICVS